MSSPFIKDMKRITDKQPPSKSRRPTKKSNQSRDLLAFVSDKSEQTGGENEMKS